MSGENEGAARSLTASEFAAALGAIGGFEPRPFVAVAVSGGSDSMALVLHAHRWSQERGGSLFGLHIDHGLRPESAAEADIVVAWLANRGIPCRILRWEGEKPISGIQEAAREARYRLLGSWCRENGCLHLMTAHQLNDQVETHLIRKRARSGPDGLAGISAVRQLTGLRLLRPLLGISRPRLAAFLAEVGQEFLTDPSNRNPAYERARLRQALPERCIADSLSEIRGHAEQRIVRDREVAAALGRVAAIHPSGAGVIDATAFAELPATTAEKLLAAVVSCIGSSRYPPRTERVQRLRTELLENPGRARTLAGCRLVPWRRRLLVFRELAAAATPLLIEPGTSTLWDGRFAVDLGGEATAGFTVDYLRDTRLPGSPGTAVDLPRLVWPSLPAFFDAQGLATVPHLGYRRADVNTPPRVMFRPANPMIRAGFTVV